MGLAAGILLVLISISHIIYGEKKQLPPLKQLTSDSVMIGSLRVMVFQGGLLLLVVGIFQILTSVGTVELTGVARYFPVGIVSLNFCTALLIAVFAHRQVLSVTVPQFVVFALIITLQLLSI